MRTTMGVLGMLLLMAAYSPVAAHSILGGNASGVDFNPAFGLDHSASPPETMAFVAVENVANSSGLHLGWSKVGNGKGVSGSGNPVSATPEPAGVILTASGLLAALYFTRRSRRRQV